MIMKILALLVLCYLQNDFIDYEQITQKLKEQEFSFLPMTHILIS